ncbi:relaxase/mobilization nuclease domain-containing protein [Ligilactobacillus ruminis]|uniref:relaxase/mobilization nuclease domain-containing protein n=1 Tax=Ligilactobacillus ruminis TaxID=1623 RepID=UPI003F99014C
MAATYYIEHYGREALTEPKEKKEPQFISTEEMAVIEERIRQEAREEARQEANKEVMNMAITKIWNIAKSKDGNLSNSLHRSLLYIVNPVKTDGGVLVGGVNVMPDAELAYEQMCETKQIFGKELGRQGYHVVLSCPVGEGDPQTMYQLTQEFIEEYLGDRYEALFAIHVDKGHLHSHIVFNSVSMIDGNKYQYTKGDWKNIIQPITNQLCVKYGWSVIPAEYVKDSERMSRDEYEYQKSLKEVILSDVEYCMSNAGNMDEFIWNLKELGYEVKQGKHLAIKAGGMKKFRRLDTLDESLSAEKIEETLAAIQGKDTTVKLITNDDYKSFKHWTSEYQRSFYVKIVHLRQMEVYRFKSKAAHRYHDLKRMNELQEQYLYLVNHKIESAKDKETDPLHPPIPESPWEKERTQNTRKDWMNCLQNFMLMRKPAGKKNAKSLKQNRSTNAGRKRIESVRKESRRNSGQGSCLHTVGGIWTQVISSMKMWICHHQ